VVARRTVKSPRLFVCALVAAACLPAWYSKPDEPDKVAPTAADSMLGKKPGQVRDDNELKMKLIWCPPGVVTMEQVARIKEADANDDETDQADLKDKPSPGPIRVLLSRGYWLGKYEVTQIEWKQIMSTEPWKGDRWVQEGADYPAADISWNDAVEFCQRLTALERKARRLPVSWEYTLPTDAQWERACRARTTTRFSFGDDDSQIGDYAWWGGNRRSGNAQNEQYPHRVGQKKPNPWGLFDMHGNVAEWCRDTYVGDPPGGRDPEVTAESRLRICRGGDWQLGPENCLCGYRCGNEPDLRNNSVGFRVALSAVRQAGADAPITTDK
jgi:formylglycine-generating enzyme required for sulfatase activity